LIGLSPGECGLIRRHGNSAPLQAVHQDNDAQALMEVGTGNSRFASPRYGIVACDNIAGGSVRGAGDTKKMAQRQAERIYRDLTPCWPTY
jgi:hypothetical protein